MLSGIFHLSISRISSFSWKVSLGPMGKMYVISALLRNFIIFCNWAAYTRLTHYTWRWGFSILFYFQFLVAAPSLFSFCWVILETINPYNPISPSLVFVASPVDYYWKNQITVILKTNFHITWCENTLHRRTISLRWLSRKC